MSFKDLFSEQSQGYSRFRPTYPSGLFDWLASQSPGRKLAWDCGTGNGQAAAELAKRFARVVATDPSKKQLESAALHSNIEYRVEPAEHSSLDAGSVQLITVAQAFHWFEAESFFAEVRRVAAPGCVLALWCYELASICPEIDALVHDLYRGTLGGYWEKERQLVEVGYRSVVLPFHELPAPRFEMTANWSQEQLLGYLGTWSALQTYVKRQGVNPLEALAPRLQKAWGQLPERLVRWPLALRVARI